MNTRNVLHEFFNSSSDANEFLEASQQEKLENAFQKYLDSKQKENSLTDATMLAYEWAKANYKLLPNEDNDEATRQWNYKIHDQRAAAERAYLAGLQEALTYLLDEFPGEEPSDGGVNYRDGWNDYREAIISLIQTKLK